MARDWLRCTGPWPVRTKERKYDMLPRSIVLSWDMSAEEEEEEEEESESISVEHSPCSGILLTSRRRRCNPVHQNTRACDHTDPDHHRGHHQRDDTVRLPLACQMDIHNAS